ncbi:MAG: phosphatase PAP2 family protein [Elusimicrobia bacterium]|nr:phosphatase PAP2 family protein [Elusimicrobiota bacterium]
MKGIIRLLAAGAVAVQFTVAPLAAEDGVVRKTVDDAGRIATAPFRMNAEEAAAVGGIAVGLGGLSLLDRTVQNHLAPWRNSGSARHLRTFGDASQAAGPVLGTAFALQGWHAHNARSMETGFLLWESFLLAGASEAVLKFAVGRKRPSTTTDPYRFHPASGNASFPSGHTTVVFAAATVLAEQYPEWYVAAPAYGVAATVGFSRLYANQHWLTDVAGGAILGTAVSHYLRKWHRDSRSAWELELDPENVRLVRRF